MKYIFIILFNLLIVNAYSQNTAEQQIKKVMNQQITCWNSGAIDAFMDTYWKSDSLVFVGKKGVTYGWQNTLDNYKRSYPSKEDMGTLEFELIKMQPLSDNFYNVIGKWHLKRKAGDLQGYYTLLFKKINGLWKIIQDHTS
ncbi:MAG: nuclear transport factor 2 family protein [Niabella sp.]|nr:nuclear transport factor 2 family protein [Niabella sp.]